MPSEIAPQADEVVFGGVEDFFDGDACEDGGKRREIGEGEGVEDVIGCACGKLDEANLFAVGVEGVGLGIDGDDRLGGEGGGESREAGRSIHPDRRWKIRVKHDEIITVISEQWIYRI